MKMLRSGMEETESAGPARSDERAGLFYERTDRVTLGDES
jgi:hypothetical protein